jgi:hypothetical protein
MKNPHNFTISQLWVVGSLAVAPHGGEWIFVGFAMLFLAALWWVSAYYDV